MQIKTNWTFNDYLDVYTLDDGTVLDVFTDSAHTTVNMNNHAINRIRKNCSDSCTLLNNVFGTSFSFSASDSITGILSTGDMNNLETIIKTLCDATGQEFEVNTWVNGSPIYASDLNRFEKPFLLLNKYQSDYNSGISFRNRVCGTFNCNDNTAKYGG